MDLLVVALAQRLDRVATIAPDTRRRALLASVQSFIDHRLGNPALSPHAIAAAHHVSPALPAEAVRGTGDQRGAVDP